MKKFLLILIVLGGAGWYLFMKPDDGAQTGTVDELPVIRAESGPVKTLPEDPGGLEVPGQDNTLFAVLDGQSEQNEETETSPLSEADIPEETSSSGIIIPAIPETESEDLVDLLDMAQPQTAPAQEPLGELVDVSDLAPSTADQIGTESDQETLPPAELSEQAVKPEIVQDYSSELIIQAESELAPPSLSVANITVTPPVKPALPAQEIVLERIAVRPAPKPITTAMMARAEQARATELEVQRAATPTPAGNNEEMLDRPLSEQPFFRDLTPQKPQAPTSMQPIMDDADQTTTAAVAPSASELERPPVAPARDATASAGQYYAQLASLPSREGAQATWSKLQDRYPALLSGKSVRFFEARVEGRGSFTRVQVGGMSEAAARDLCAELSAAGKRDGCLVLRGS